jgi:hypothetical protein
MPFVLLVLGVYAIAVAVHGNTAALSQELIKTMSGFVVWAAAIIVLSIWATVGPEASQKVGRAFLGLVAVGFILSNGKGLISQGQHFVGFVKNSASGASSSKLP